MGLSAIVAALGGIRGTVFAGIALLALSFAGVQSYRLQVARGATALLAAKYADAERDAVNAARAEEQTKARAVNLVASAYERGRADEKAVADRTTAGLLSGNQRLRAEIRALANRMPGDPGAAGEPAGAAERGAELVGAAVGVGRACDLRIQALIDAYDAARGTP